jgi:hypothetical protein
MMEQWYKCPQCSGDILYATNPCPYCKSSLDWAERKPVKYIPPPSIADIKERVKSGDMILSIQGIEPPIILQPSEKLIIAIPGFSLIEPRAIRDTKAIYGGSSIRIAKGMSLRLGGAAARSESHDELRVIDTGIFTLTTQRVVFSGTRKTITTPLANIVSLEPYNEKDAEGVGIRKESKMQYFTCPLKIFNAISLNFTIDGNKLSDEFSGEWLINLIEGQIHKSQSENSP